MIKIPYISRETITFDSIVIDLILLLIVFGCISLFITYCAAIENISLKINDKQAKTTKAIIEYKDCARNPCNYIGSYTINNKLYKERILYTTDNIVIGDEVLIKYLENEPTKPWYANRILYSLKYYWITTISFFIISAMGLMYMPFLRDKSLRNMRTYYR